MKPLGFIWRWKAKETEPVNINPWQFRDVPVHESNYHLLDMIPVYGAEAIKQAKREALLEAADVCGESRWTAVELRQMAEMLK